MWILLIIYLFILSFYLSCKLKFKNYKINIKELILKDKTSLFLTLGTKMGVGSIIGTISSILIGGFSSVLWIIIFSLIWTSIVYYESYYGNKYSEKGIGGPYFIFKNGLNNRYLAIISTILLIILYSFLFQMIQFNTMSYIFINTLNISKILLVILSSILLFITINLSIKNILNIMNKVVPYMCIIFICISLYVVIINFNNINITILLKDLLSFKSIMCGLVIGIKRSIFMNEILVGTTSVGAASDKNDINISTKYQILCVFFISIVITLLITFLLLIYLNNNIIYGTDYNLILVEMFNSLLGKFGIYFLLIIYILFGFTTVLSGYYIGSSLIKYIFNNKIMINLFKIIFIVSCIIGIIYKNEIIWKYTDILIFIMIIINSYSIIKLVIKDDRK